MRVWNSVLALCLTLQFAVGQEVWRPTFLGQTRVKHAAFLEVYQSEDESLPYNDRWNLYVSTFDALALSQYDDVYFMSSPGSYLDSVSTWSENNLVVYDTSAYWPNDMNYMPSTVVGTEGIVQTSGFLVTTKKDGQLQLYDTTGELPVLMANIAEGDSDEWSYHRVMWQDMDLDGDLDAVTARFHLPNIGNTKTEFVWFENPDATTATPGWTEHVISDEGPDVSFARTVLSAGGKDYEVYIFAEFFTERIEIFWTENADNDWSDTASISSRVINPAAGQAFDVIVDDFNRDGVLEFLVTEYDTETTTGHVKVYFFPEDFRTGDYDSVIIADGFVPNSGVGSNNYMSPGSPKTYYPSVYYAEELAEDGLPHKPYMLVSGDDDGRMYILYPINDDRSDWTYEKNILVDTEDTTCGKMTNGDLDGDGYEEIIVAGYSSGQLYVYTYNPAA